LKESLFLAFFEEELFVGIKRLGDDVFDRHTGIQRRIGILENHLGVEMEILQILLRSYLRALFLERKLFRHNRLWAICFDFFFAPRWWMGIDFDTRQSALIWLTSCFDSSSNGFRAIEDDFAIGRLIKMENRAAQRGFATAGFADDAEVSPRLTSKETSSTALRWRS
jgi:hypothetical protein